MVAWEDVYGFECTDCRGQFIRANSINTFLTRNDTPHRYLEHLEQCRESPPSRRALLCPDCGVRAYRALHIEVLEVDACAGCGGVYLDAGEASHYLAHVRTAPPPIRHPRTFAERERLRQRIVELMIQLFFR
jgi:Zn-finger nucleic acid-binding protein